MTTSNQQKQQETGQPPSMFASLLVLGVMVALILQTVLARWGRCHPGLWRRTWR